MKKWGKLPDSLNRSFFELQRSFCTRWNRLIELPTKLGDFFIVGAKNSALWGKRCREVKIRGTQKNASGHHRFEWIFDFFSKSGYSYPNWSHILDLWIRFSENSQKFHFEIFSIFSTYFSIPCNYGTFELHFPFWWVKVQLHYISPRLRWPK